MARSLSRAICALALVLICAGCRLDVGVSVEMNSDGSGTITLNVLANKAVLDRAPTLADDLRLDDVRRAGWEVDGPTSTDDGGLQLTMSRPFATPQEATAVLANLNGPAGPLSGVTLSRTRDDDTVRFELTGALKVDGGIAAFGDPDLLAVLGATPYEAQLAAAGTTAGDAIGITFTADLPGTVTTTTGTGASPLVWAVPLDGTALDLATVTQTEDEKNVWAGPLSKVAFWAMVAWIIVAACFIAYVVVVRRRRAAIRALR